MNHFRLFIHFSLHRYDLRLLLLIDDVLSQLLLDGFMIFILLSARLMFGPFVSCWSLERMLPNQK